MAREGSKGAEGSQHGLRERRWSATAWRSPRLACPRVRSCHLPSLHRRVCTGCVLSEARGGRVSVNLAPALPRGRPTARVPRGCPQACPAPGGLPLTLGPPVAHSALGPHPAPPPSHGLQKASWAALFRATLVLPAPAPAWAAVSASETGVARHWRGADGGVRTTSPHAAQAERAGPGLGE